MVCWELMAEKQPFHEVKRVWDLPRIVVDGLRPTIEESWPRGMQRLIADCWMVHGALDTRCWLIRTRTCVGSNRKSVARR